MSGPIGVVQSVSTVASFGWGSLMTLAALIAINIGIVNLLPIPAMDGGRLVFLFIELIRGKPVKAEHEGMVHFIGIVALMVLMVIVTFNDLSLIHISEPTRQAEISYAVFCLKKKKQNIKKNKKTQKQY